MSRVLQTIFLWLGGLACFLQLWCTSSWGSRKSWTWFARDICMFSWVHHIVWMIWYLDMRTWSHWCVLLLMQTLGVFFRVVIGMVSHTLSNLNWLTKASYTLNEDVSAQGSNLWRRQYLVVDDLAWLGLKLWLSAEEWHLIMVSNPKGLYSW